MKSYHMAAAILLALAAWIEPSPAGTESGYTKSIQVSPLLRTTETIAGQPIAYSRVENPEVTSLLVEIPPGAETGWHRHPFPCYAYMLAGTIEVSTRDGTVRSFKAGDAFAESVNVPHNGRNTGTEPVKIILFVTGEKGQPFTVRETEMHQ